MQWFQHFQPRHTAADPARRRRLAPGAIGAIESSLDWTRMAVKTEWRCRSNLHVAIVVEIVVLVAPWLARGTSPRERGGRARQSVAWPTAMDPDHRIRAAAFVAISQLSRQFNDHVPWDAIGEGFSVAGETILFANRSKGIFKPRQMSAALSIKTTVPRFGRTTWYRDQDSSNLDGATGLLRYELARGNDPTNDALRKAWQRGAHLIYFMGVAPAVYQPVFPVWIADFSPAGRHVLLATADFLVAGQLDQHVAAVRDSVEVSYSPNDHTYAESPGVVQRSHQGGIPKPMRFQRTTCPRAAGGGPHSSRQGWGACVGAERNLHVDAAPRRVRLAPHRS